MHHYIGTAEEIKPERALPKADRNFWGAAEPPADANAEAPAEPLEYKITRKIFLGNTDWNFLASFTLRIGEDHDTNNAGVLRHIFASDLPGKILDVQREVKDYTQRLESLGKILQEKFTHQAEIEQIEGRLAELNRLISEELGDAEPKCAKWRG